MPPSELRVVGRIDERAPRRGNRVCRGNVSGARNIHAIVVRARSSSFCARRGFRLAARFAERSPAQQRSPKRREFVAAGSTTFERRDAAATSPDASAVSSTRFGVHARRAPLGPPRANLRFRPRRVSPRNRNRPPHNVKGARPEPPRTFIHVVHPPLRHLHPGQRASTSSLDKLSKSGPSGAPQRAADVEQLARA